MREKINVAEILKSKPAGTMLYDNARNICVYLEDVAKGANGCYGITCTFDTDRVQKLYYSNKGTLPFFENGMVILTPSKKMCDWEKFTWEKGDVLVCYKGARPYYTIFDSFESNAYNVFKGKFAYNVEEDKWYHGKKNLSTNTFCKLSRADSKKYVTKIEERFGGKLNCETLEIEKLQPEFKDGDILSNPSNIKPKKHIFIFNEFDNDKDFKYHVALAASGEIVTPMYNCVWCHKDSNVRYATKNEKQQLFSALERIGKAWDAEKKKVVDLKPKVELKPFDKVLVRNRNTDHWEADLFGFKSDGFNILYHCVGSFWKFCIPYIGNESLLGTTKDVED